jgi:uncharacterized damage-inducible protein DinB
MRHKSALLFTMVLMLGVVPAVAQSSTTSVAKEVTDNFVDINRKLLEMAKDFPEDKYDFRLRPEMRSFHDVLVHIASGNVYAAKAGRGEKVKWDELNPKDYPNKAAVVAMFEKSAADAASVLKSWPAAQFDKTVEPWIDVLEHSGEHYGLLVAYYRANGLVPPESRPKK